MSLPTTPNSPASTGTSDKPAELASKLATEAGVPDAPRSLSPFAAKDLWFEPRVWFWLVASVVMLLVCIWLCVSQSMKWNRDRQLIVSGTQVQATVADINGITRVGYKDDPSWPVTLRFELDGQARAVRGILEGRSEKVEVGMTLPIRVDPTNYQRWTYRADPPSLLVDLAAPLLVILPVIGAALAAMMTKSSLSNLWKSGKVVPAVIGEVKSNAVSPARPRATCLASDGNSRSTIVVHLAPNQRHLKRGDVIWAVVSADKRRAASAAVFDRKLLQVMTNETSTAAAPSKA